MVRDVAARKVSALCCLGLLAVLSTCLASAAQNSPALNNDASAQELVRITVANEVAASGKGTTKQMFLSCKHNSGGSETEIYVETTEATAGLLIERNNQPISDQEVQGEVARLDRMSGNPDELRRKQKQEHEDADHTLRIVKALPEAFLYQFDGTEPGTTSVGKSGDELVRLKFRPNPNYSYPSHVEEVLAGMQGALLIDQQNHRIARIDAVLFKRVSFGWGILGHLDKGGTFLVEQAEVSPGDWELTHLQLNFTGKIMMVKSLAIKSDETLSNFHTVPSDTTFAKGVEMLKAEQARLQKKEGPAHTAANKNQR